ncbi:MAG: leucyl aminopeptidase family protein [Pseudomonadota bacterium]
MSENSSPEPALQFNLSEQAYYLDDANPDRADLDTILIKLVLQDDLDQFQATLDEKQLQWLAKQSFTAKVGQFAWLPHGQSQCLVVGTDAQEDFRTLGNLALTLPEGTYRLDSNISDQAVIGWGLGAYQFLRYRSAKRMPAQLIIPNTNDTNRICNVVDSMALSRDLVNTPAADMAPSHLAAEVQALAEKFAASFNLVSGDELLDMQCGAIHAVGRAAEDPPCLVDLEWGEQSNPSIVLVGKGVTFDSGGLDLKPASGMRLMKKDMGGAATAIGLAHLIMAQQLPVHLRLLVPAAENAVAGNAFRPGDILQTRKGLTVEIDNTDAEGRLLLCDALALACEEKPDYIFDFATLTGSARSAVGTEIAAMFCNDDDLAATLGHLSKTCADPVWHMPLHSGYEHMIDSKIADMVNSAASPYAGSVTAALYLQRFVEDCIWTHFDIMAFNTRNRPGHPEGGEAMALRTVFTFLEQLPNESA